LVTTLEQAFRDQWGRVLASLIGFLGDFDLAEEATQEAFAIAAERWPQDGVPANPGAWLVTTARNRAINRIRRDRTLTAKTRLLQVPQAAEDTMDATTFPDERLELIFTCCHPALATEAQVALTLRTLHGRGRIRDQPPPHEPHPSDRGRAVPSPQAKLATAHPGVAAAAHSPSAGAS
jgi:RNA polymerase sigma-70 factor, ECF subfamily